MVNKTSSFCLLILLLWGSIACQSNENTRMTLEKKGLKTYPLDKRLREISGLTYHPEAGVYFALEDERGVLFTLDSTFKVIDTQTFKKKGDFEGIVYHNHHVYCLVANGDIYNLTLDDKLKITHVSTRPTQFSKANDTEGICWDPVTQKFMILCKEKPLHKKKGDNRFVYLVNPITYKIETDPFLTLSLEKVQALNKDIKTLKPASITTNKEGNLIYITDSKAGCLYLLKRDGSLMTIKDTYLKQPEGVCFGIQNQLYIASEGKKGIILEMNIAP